MVFIKFRGVEYRARLGLPPWEKIGSETDVPASSRSSDFNPMPGKVYPWETFADNGYNPWVQQQSYLVRGGHVLVTAREGGGDIRVLAHYEATGGPVNSNPALWPARTGAQL